MVTANEALRFFLELCALAALAFWGFWAGGSLPWNLLLGLGAPLLAAVVWGIWVAPRSSRRLAVPARLLPEALVFGSAAAGLFASGHPVAATIFVLLVIANEVMLYVPRR